MTYYDRLVAEKDRIKPKTAPPEEAPLDPDREPPDADIGLEPENAPERAE